MTADAKFCSHCGAVMPMMPVQPPPMPVYGAPMYAPPAYYNRVARHVQVLGILWAVYAAYHLVTKLIGVTIFNAWLRHNSDFNWGPWDGSGFMHAMLPVTILTLIISTAVSVAAAIGLLQREGWGRIMAIVAAVWALIHPVMGTALGIYTLWVLAPAASGVEYDALTQSRQQQQS